MRDGPYYVINGRCYDLHKGGRALPSAGFRSLTLDRGSRSLAVAAALG